MRLDLDKARQVIEPILKSCGVELVDLNFVIDQGRPVLRLLIDRDGGVQLGDCERVSRDIEVPLEIEGITTDRYFLEVSSPGLNRPLKKEGDFQRFIGQTAQLRLREGLEGRRNFKGILQKFEDQTIYMLVDGKEYQIPFSSVEKAHLVYE